MELAECDIPESVFLELSLEDLLLSTPEREPVSVFFDELVAIPLPDPVSEIVPEHGTEYRRDDREGEVCLRPESSDEDHDIHPWYCRPDDRQWLDTCRGECDEIVPVAECLDECTDPVDSHLDPLWTCKWYDDDTKSQECESDSEKFRDKWKCLFDHEKRG